MEQLGQLDEVEQRAAAQGYDLQRRVAIAERRHADACADLRKAREECQVFETASDARIEVLKIVRARLAAAEVSRRRLHAELEGLRRLIP